MGYIMAIYMAIGSLLTGEVQWMYCAALFYIGASIGACAGNIEEIANKLQN